MFLVAPSGSQRVQLGAQGGQPLFELLIELLEVLGETPEFGGVDNRLGHRALDPPGTPWPSSRYQPRDKPVLQG
jgi:hypothetical protein